MMHPIVRSLLCTALGLVLAWAPLTGSAYPLDGFDETGLTRLLHQRWIQEGSLPGKRRPSGELLPMEKVELRLLDRQGFTLPAPDPQFTAQVKRLLGGYASRYGIAVLDFSDPQRPAYAEFNGSSRQNPGSVGKIMVALAIFQALADIYPDDIDSRKRVLRESMIVADEFSVYDHHTVRFFNPETRVLVRHPLHKGDTASMWTYMDWMMSPSSNSAAGMLQKHLILLRHYGKDYPVSREEENRFYRETPRAELTQIFADAMHPPVERNGLDTEALRQGSFFTRGGKQRVGGAGSYATPRGLMQFMLQMEKGKLVDEWSSREIKRLLYVTERRIRYASSGALRPSAVYFKSGSLYSCVEEAGFTCKKYHGNKRNFMNSIAIVETPAGQDRLYYMAAVLSNVLRKNSAADHRDLARAIHAQLLAKHPSKNNADGSPASSTYGEGFIGFAEERELLTLKTDTQEALILLGYDIGDIDGAIGPVTRKAIRAFQKAEGLPANGQPSLPLLKTMREVAQKKGLARPYAAGQASSQ